MICTSAILKYGAPEPPYFTLWSVDGNAIVRLITEFGRAKFCYPHPELTVVRHVFDAEIDEQGNYVVITLKTYGGYVYDVFVFSSDVFRRVYDFARAAVEEPERARGHLLILQGPPGTGKSSLANVILPSLLAVPYEVVTAGEILSKWVGESEKKLLKRLRKAQQMQGGFVLSLEEMDILVASEVYGDREGYGAVASNMKNVFKYELQKITLSRSKALVAVSTNLPSDYIDKALVRSGRGTLVSVPFLDRGAVALLVERLAKVHGVEPPTWAVERLVKIRASPADINYWIQELKRNPKAEPPSPFEYKPCGVFAPKKIKSTGWCRGSRKQDCKCPQEGEHYLVTFGEDLYPFEKMCRVLQYLAENCNGALPLLSLEREEVKEKIKLAVSTKTPLVVFPTVSAEHYMYYFAGVRDVPVIFLDLKEIRASEPMASVKTEHVVGVKMWTE